MNFKPLRFPPINIVNYGSSAKSYNIIRNSKFYAIKSLIDKFISDYKLNFNFHKYNQTKHSPQFRRKGIKCIVFGDGKIPKHRLSFCRNILRGARILTIGCDIPGAEVKQNFCQEFHYRWLEAQTHTKEHLFYNTSGLGFKSTGLGLSHCKLAYVDTLEQFVLAVGCGCLPLIPTNFDREYKFVGEGDHWPIKIDGDIQRTIGYFQEREGTRLEIIQSLKERINWYYRPLSYYESVLFSSLYGFAYSRFQK